jgi:opacity protein-like surface antigen
MHLKPIHTTMNKIISFILASFIFSISIFSQSADSSSLQKNFSRKNKWALQFQAGYNLQVQAFNGMTISLKYHISEKSAFRLGAGYYGQIENDNIEHYEYSENHFYSQQYYNYQFTGVINYIYYINPFSRFNVYWGIGPAVKYNYNYDESPSGSLEGYTNIYERTQWSAGLSGVLGVEWLPVPDFSLFAEYEAAGFYGKSRTASKLIRPQGCYVEKTESKGEEWSFEGNRALLGISVYFSRLF